MMLYRARLRLRSAVGTPWQADTIFGHLCWALRYRSGPAAVEELLEEYRLGSPPFLVSNGFPGDYLPRPLCPPTTLAQGDSSLANRREVARAGKEAAREEHLTLDEFNRALRGELVVPSRKESGTGRAVLKNQISRATGTTGGEGQLYEFDETYWPEVSVYVRAAPDRVGQARELFGWLAELGYGKRRSTGYGEVESFTWEGFTGIAEPAEANGFVSLSNFAPARGDPTDGYWRTLVKYGKLGEEYATAGNPFKRPVVMLAAGSCLYSAAARFHYGRLVAGVSDEHPDVVQYGLALPVPVRLPALG